MSQNKGVMLMVILTALILAILSAGVVIGVVATLWYDVNYGHRKLWTEYRLLEREDDAISEYLSEVYYWEETAWWRETRRQFRRNALRLAMNVFTVIVFTYTIFDRDFALFPVWVNVFFLLSGICIIFFDRYPKSRRLAYKLRFPFECGKLAVAEYERGGKMMQDDEAGKIRLGG